MLFHFHSAAHASHNPGMLKCYRSISKPRSSHSCLKKPPLVGPIHPPFYLTIGP